MVAVNIVAKRNTFANLQKRERTVYGLMTCHNSAEGEWFSNTGLHYAMNSLLGCKPISLPNLLKSLNPV
jgi:hypothetical protein